jgi:hypothetical protein
MHGEYVGYVAGEDPLHGFLRRIMRDRLGVREPQLAFRVFRLSGSNEVYRYEEKFSGAKVICKFYGTRFGTDLSKAAWMARQEYEGLETLRRYHLIGSPHHVIRPLGLRPFGPRRRRRASCPRGSPHRPGAATICARRASCKSIEAPRQTKVIMVIASSTRGFTAHQADTPP